MPEFEVTVTISAEERLDCWAVWVDELAFFAYGRTEESAIERVGELLGALAASFRSEEPSGFEEYLRMRGVTYKVQSADSELAVNAADIKAEFPPMDMELMHPAVPRLRVFPGVEVPNAFAV